MYKRVITVKDAHVCSRHAAQHPSINICRSQTAEYNAGCKCKTSIRDLVVMNTRRSIVSRGPEGLKLVKKYTWRAIH